METSVDLSQTDTSIATPADFFQVPANVTAAVNTADTATPTQESATQQGAAPQEAVTTGTTGAGVDETGTNTPDTPEPRTASAPPSMQEYERRKAALLSNTPSTPAENPAPAQAPAPNAAPPPANTPAAPAAVDDEGDFPTAPVPGQQPKAIKLRPADERDVRVMAEFKASQKAGNKQTFVEFVQTRYPAQQQAAPAATQAGEASQAIATTSETPNTVQTVAEADAKLKQLKEQRYKALGDFDFENARQIEEQEEQMRAQREQLQRHESVKASEVEQRRAAEQQRYLEQAGALYPQATQPGDPLVVQADAVYKEWERNNDPRIQHPSGLLLCYMEAASILGVPAAAPQAPHPVQKPSLKPSTPPPVPKVPVSVLVASGNAAQTQTRAPEDNRSYEEKKADFLRKTAGRAA